MIRAADVTLNYAARRSIVADDLRRLDEPCVVLEESRTDSDGQPFHIFTVGGILDGQPLGDMRGGVTVGGEVIVIPVADVEAAKQIASDGLETTINAMQVEQQRYLSAQQALARLSTVGAAERLALAIKPDSEKSDALVRDQAAIRPLIGDDILLTVGGQEAPNSARLTPIAQAVRGLH